MCHISSILLIGLLIRQPSGADDLHDADLGEVLAMALLAPRILTPALLESDQLRAARLFDDLGDHLGTGDQRRADLDAVAIVEGGVRVGDAREVRDVDGNAELERECGSREASRPLYREGSLVDRLSLRE